MRRHKRHTKEKYKRDHCDFEIEKDSMKCGDQRDIQKRLTKEITGTLKEKKTQ